MSNFPVIPKGSLQIRQKMRFSLKLNLMLQMSCRELVIKIHFVIDFVKQKKKKTPMTGNNEALNKSTRNAIRTRTRMNSTKARSIDEIFQKTCWFENDTFTKHKFDAIPNVLNVVNTRMMMALKMTKRKEKCGASIKISQ